MKNTLVEEVVIQKYTGQNGLNIHHDTIMIEEPLQINTIDAINGKKPSSITMRSPGHDSELALGFMYGEGMIDSKAAIEKVIVSDGQTDVYFKEDHQSKIKSERNFYITSSCGVCGKSSIEELKIHSGKKEVVKTFDPKKIENLYTQMQSAQSSFVMTGGCHGAAIFDYEGNLIVCREDVGRHNAVDKCAGYLFNNELISENEYILCLSGRSCYELIQKALRINCTIVISIGAATSLAVQTAAEFNITLMGFYRPDRYNVYSGGDRVMRESGDRGIG